MTEHWLHPIIPTSIPTSTLARADELVRKTAFLAGLVAPETAACLSELLKVSNAHYSSVIDGNPSEPESLEREFILEHHQRAFGDIPELRRRIVAVLCQHYQLLHRPTHREGVRAFARALTFEHFDLLGLHPHLWSLSRGLARRLVEYQSATAVNEPMGKDGLEGGQKRIGGGQPAFIDFMLDVCREEVDHMSFALSRRQLREQVLLSFKKSERITSFRMSPEIAPAIIALLIQGSLPRIEFKAFTGIQSEEVGDELSKLESLGILVTSKHKPDSVEPRLPAWFAHEILPTLQLL